MWSLATHGNISCRSKETSVQREMHGMRSFSTSVERIQSVTFQYPSRSVHIAEGFPMIMWPFTHLVQCRSWGTAGLLHCTPQGQSWSADSGQLALVKGKGQSRSGIWWARPGQMDRIIWITNMLLYFHLIPFLELVYLALIAHCVVCWVRRHGSGVGLESHIRWNNNDGRFPNLQRD